MIDKQKELAEQKETERKGFEITVKATGSVDAALDDLLESKKRFESIIKNIVNNKNT